MADSKHLPALDGLRGVAILMVIAGHVSSGLFGALSLYQNTNGMAHSFAMPRWLDVIASCGYHGVTLFFVVSAFTLMRQALHGGLQDVWGYMLRRVFRIGPGFWVAAIAYAALLGLGPRQSAPAGFVAIDLVMGATFAGWLGSHSALNIVPGGWSVQTEIVFYTLLPVLTWLMAGRFWRAALITVAAVVAAQGLARMSMVQGTWSYDSYVVPLVQLPVFMLGVSAAFCLSYRLPERLRRWVPGAALLALGLAIAVVPFSPVRDWWLLGHVQFAALAALATLLSAWAPPRLLTAPILVRVGTVSYSMYLIHFVLLWPMFMVAQWAWPANDAVTMTLDFLLVCAGSYGMACLSYAVVEQPPRRWIASRLRARGVASRTAVNHPAVV